MSPSNTIHLGPVWEMFACSLISDENKPYAGIYKQKQLRLQSDLYTTLITLHWFMCFNVYILILNQAFFEKNYHLSTLELWDG